MNELCKTLPLIGGIIISLFCLFDGYLRCLRGKYLEDKECKMIGIILIVHGLFWLFVNGLMIADFYY